AGARLVMVDGNFDQALTAVRHLGEERAAAVVNSVNPDRLEGQQTAAWEVCDALGRAPDALGLPVGNAGNITAYWRGFSRYADEVLAGQREIAQLEGVFCEPASAAGVAGVRKLATEGRVHRSETVVCVLTGHGLKDPDAIGAEEGTLTPVAPDVDAIRAAMGM